MHWRSVAKIYLTSVLFIIVKIKGTYFGMHACDHGPTQLRYVHQLCKVQRAPGWVVKLNKSEGPSLMHTCRCGDGRNHSMTSRYIRAFIAARAADHTASSHRTGRPGVPCVRVCVRETDVSVSMARRKTVLIPLHWCYQYRLTLIPLWISNYIH